MCVTNGLSNLNDYVLENTKDNNDELILYHYTTSKGLLGILENNSFFASNFKCFNDPSEFKFGIYTINNEIKKMLEKETNNKIKNAFEGIEFDSLGNLNKAIEQLYALSFSENGDLLPQWQTYGKNGKGYSIGIKKNKLGSAGLNLNELKDNQYNIRDKLIKIIYKKDIHINIAKCFYNDLKKFNNEKEIKKYYYQILPLLALVIKHSAYENEREWRVIFRFSDISSYHKYIEFYERNNVVIPYVKFDFKNGIICLRLNDNYISTKIPIELIYLGPTNTTDESMIRSLLLKQEYFNTTIKKSNIPYISP
ncbi:MAG: DUF2971 domain-containing protein [Nanoarchaeota archaeon]|nr:DUF2971 domain-containing protein [Nanoarchaeota archaeon]